MTRWFSGCSVYEIMAVPLAGLVSLRAKTDVVGAPLVPYSRRVTTRVSCEICSKAAMVECNLHVCGRSTRSTRTCGPCGPCLDRADLENLDELLDRRTLRNLWTLRNFWALWIFLLSLLTSHFSLLLSSSFSFSFSLILSPTLSLTLSLSLSLLLSLRTLLLSYSPTLTLSSLSHFLHTFCPSVSPLVPCPCRACVSCLFW